jgi:CMP-N-acetylneuraminic acid synthetase
VIKSRPEVLAIIPARGGSKTIPKKNIRPLDGHPLIAYSIAAGHKSRQVTRVILSTDDEEIAEVARAYGGEVPFLRPADLARDETPDLPVFQHALNWLAEKEGYLPEAVVQLRPTSPIRPPDCVDRAISALLEHRGTDSVRSVIPSGQNPYKMWRLDPVTGRLEALLALDNVPEPYNAPRQLLPATYWQTGHVDVVRTATVLEKHSMTGEIILPLILDPRYATDIDGLFEWQFAEWLVEQGILPMVRPGSRPGG